MVSYTVARRYTARRDGQTFGPWEPGDQVDLEPDDADWVNRDSPGALEPNPKSESAAGPAAGKGGGRSGGRRGGA